MQGGCAWRRTPTAAACPACIGVARAGNARLRAASDGAPAGLGAIGSSSVARSGAPPWRGHALAGGSRVPGAGSRACGRAGGTLAAHGSPRPLPNRHCPTRCPQTGLRAGALEAEVVRQRHPLSTSSGPSGGPTRKNVTGADHLPRRASLQDQGGEARGPRGRGGHTSAAGLQPRSSAARAPGDSASPMSRASDGRPPHA